MVFQALLACQGSTAPATGAIVCEVAQSSDRCFTCQAQRCAAELDRCHGAGFHQGRSVLTEPAKCAWNANPDGTCRAGLGEDGGPPARLTTSAPCGWRAACLQSCGCGQECARSCQATAPDGGVATTGYYSNDPRVDGPCNDCVVEHLTPCTRQRCAAECPQ